MKYLTDRHEIAKAMNFGKYPVLHINVETPEKGYEGFYVGDEVKVMTPTKRYPDLYATGQLYLENGRYGVLTHGTMLKNSFDYHDVMEMLKFAQAPVLHAGEQVVVIENFPGRRRCRVHMMKVSDCVDRFVNPCCTLEEID